MPSRVQVEINQLTRQSPPASAASASLPFEPSGSFGSYWFEASSSLEEESQQGTGTQRHLCMQMSNAFDVGVIELCEYRGHQQRHLK